MFGGDGDRTSRSRGKIGGSGARPRLRRACRSGAARGAGAAGRRRSARLGTGRALRYLIASSVAPHPGPGPGRPRQAGAHRPDQPLPARSRPDLRGGAVAQSLQQILAGAVRHARRLARSHCNNRGRDRCFTARSAKNWRHIAATSPRYAKKCGHCKAKSSRKKSKTTASQRVMARFACRNCSAARSTCLSSTIWARHAPPARCGPTGSTACCRISKTAPRLSCRRPMTRRRRATSPRRAAGISAWCRIRVRASPPIWAIAALRVGCRASRCSAASASGSIAYPTRRSTRATISARFITCSICCPTALPAGVPNSRTEKRFMTTEKTAMPTHKTGTPEEWLAARLELLQAEKELTRRSDELRRRRQELPWVRIDKEYRFDTDEGSASLADLFRGRSQILVYHFMFGSDYTAGCPSCSAIADGFNGFAVHLANHDVMLWAVSRAPLAKLQAYKRRMEWTFPWASSAGSDFNSDFGVRLTEEQQRKGAFEYNSRRSPSSKGSGARFSEVRKLEEA